MDDSAEITTGVNAAGLRWARLGEWRVVAYALGGFCLQRHVDGLGWILTRPGTSDTAPPEVRRALCAALGLTCPE